MADTFILIKEVSLNNNCPECFSKEGLRIAFKQRFIETMFYKSITSEVKHTMTCKTCNSDIYPERWTEDIERVVEYQQKAFLPNKTSTYLKRASWVLISILGAILITILISIFYFEL
jgi:hypothetical protein